MASNSKYNIDVNKVRKPGNVGTSGIFIGTGSGNRESFYAVRGTGNGSVVIYDKVLYELEMNNITNVSAAGANVALSSYIVKNQRTHGSGTIDSAITFTPTSVTIQPNTDTANTKTGEVTVTQFDDALNDYVGASVTISWAQEKDYPVSIALTLNTPSDIPAGGGSVSSVGNSVSCTYRSGNVRQLGTNEYSISWGSAVSANSLTDNEKVRTKIGDLTATASYTCNGITVSASTSVPVYQQENKVESTTYDNPVISLSTPTVIASGGGSSQLSVSSCSQKFTKTYTSTYPSSGSVTTGFAYSWASSNANFTVNPTTGASTTVSASANPGTSDRSTTITCEAILNGKTGTTTTTVTQSSSYGFSVSPTSFVFGNGGGSSALTITNPNGYSWTYNGPTWITANTTSGSAGATIVLTVGQNTGAQRSGTITIKDTTNNKTFTVSVSQDAPGYSFSVAPSSFSFVSGATSGTITITNPNGYSWTLTGLPNWITANVTAGTSNATITLTVSENTGDTRSKTITVTETTYGQTTKNITCTQEAKGDSKLTPYIDHVYHGYYFYDFYDKESLDFDSAGTSQTIIIKSDSTHPWTAKTGEVGVDWIYVSPNTGIGDAVVTVSAATNTSSARTSVYGLLFAKSYTPNSSLVKSKRIKVNQSGGTGPAPVTTVLINYTMDSSNSYLAAGKQCEVYFGKENCRAGDSDSSNNFLITAETPLGGQGTLTAYTSGDNVTFGVELSPMEQEIFSRIDLSYSSYSDTGVTQAAITLPKSQVVSGISASITVWFQRQ